MDVLEFPITIPNQERVERIITYSSYLSIAVSLIVGVVSQNLLALVVAFAAQFALTLLIVLPNWPFLSPEPSLEWLQINY